MDKIELKDFLEYRFLSGLESAGNGVVFIAAKANEKDNRYDKDLFLLRDGKVTQLTFTGDATTPVYHDGRVWMLLKRTEEDKKPGYSSLYSLPLDEPGEAKRELLVRESIQSFRFLKDGKLLVKYAVDARFENIKDKDEVDKKVKELKDFEEIEEVPFYFNGAGFGAFGYSKLGILDPKDGRLETITPKNFDVDGYRFTDEDESKLLLIGSKRSPKPSRYNELSIIDMIDRKLTKLIPQSKKWDIVDAFMLGDKLIFAGTQGKEYGINQNASFYQYEYGEITEFSYWGESLWNSVGTDCALGGSKTAALHDGRYWFTTTIREHSEIRCLDEDGFITPLENDGWGKAEGFVFSDDGLYTIEMKKSTLQEIYRNGERQTSFNDRILEGKYVAIPEKIDYENDGVDLDGWVLLPKDYDPEKTYPAILDIHGGPKTVYGEVFYHEMQVWANKGWFVMFCNPRGGDGRGDEFADIRGKYGTVDYSDIMKFVDVVLEKYPQIDPKRIGETGGSYGGFMSNWILGHTDRFAAIATQRSISNWVSMWGTSDIGQGFVDDQTGAKLMDGEAEKIWLNSPLPYIIENAKTPTLIIHSDEDYRCPIEQGYQLLSVLKMRNVPSRMVIFHGETHELSRSGKPKGRIKRLTEITDWMEKYIG